MAITSELWNTLEHAIVHYTGLSPATFFTVLAAALAFYYVVSGFFDAPPPPPPVRREVEPTPPPVEIGEIDEEELKKYDGKDTTKPLLMAIKGQIYDVSHGRMFYGPGGPYEMFAGKDASRALAKMSFEEQDLTGDISGLGPFELDALNDWEYKFQSKYQKVGTIKKVVPVTEEVSASETTEASTQTTDRSLDDVQPVHVAKEEDSSTVEDSEAKHVEEPKEVAVEEDSETKHVEEKKEVAVEDNTKEE